MNAIFRAHLTGGPWLDAVLTLPKGGWISAGYESGLVTHGAQLAPAGQLRLRALPVLPGEGAWMVLGEYRQNVSCRFEPRKPSAMPAFVPAQNCQKGCAPFVQPMPFQLTFEEEPQKALSYPATGLVVIDPSFWASIPTVAGRLAVLGHEIGHLMGAECQTCADAYAGRYLKAIGISSRDAIQAFDSAIHSRKNAALALAEGEIT